MTEKIIKSISLDGGTTYYNLKDEEARLAIGTLTDLTTESKSDLVSALNEVNAKSITVDSELSESSTNPLQNAVITAALNLKQDTLTAGTGVSISDEGIISITGGTAEWGNIQGELSEQSDLMAELEGKQLVSNLVTSISLSSSDETYPSAKAVYNTVANAEYEIGIESYEDGILSLRGNTEYHQGDISTVEDTLPLFFSTWTTQTMSDKWVKADGTYLSKVNYYKQYNYLVKILNGELQNTGLSVKASTDTFDDYDFVVNTTNQTFRLPLLNGEEDRCYNGCEVVNTLNIPINNLSDPFRWTAPYNCEIEIGLKGSSSSRLYLGKSYNSYGTLYVPNEDNKIQAHMLLKKGDKAYITSSYISEKYAEIIYKHKGNGDLYFLINNETQSSGGSSVTDSNFIPKGTIFHIEEDGSGDFNSLQEVVAYLNGKYSNGHIIIEFGTGTFETADNIWFNSDDFNISHIIIRGQGIDNTILSCNGATTFGYGITTSKVYLTIQDLTYIKTQGTKDTQYRGFGANFTTLIIHNVKTVGCGEAFLSECGGTIYLTGTIQVYNSRAAFAATVGKLVSAWGTELILNNVGYAISVYNGGYIQFNGDSTLAKTNVTTVFNQTKGTMTNNGYISAPFQ